MTRVKPGNQAASVRQRLMNVAKERGEEFQYVLTRYGMERLLYRLYFTRCVLMSLFRGSCLGTHCPRGS
ncbi:MAG TPA: hypothetical protein PLY87_19485, partial [Planctomycetaceae bacterium]|nr:hypothetical protein [Planctomycetaceae bacterium]